jgi:hypothetical protein
MTSSLTPSAYASTEQPLNNGSSTSSVLSFIAISAACLFAVLISIVAVLIVYVYKRKAQQSVPRYGLAEKQALQCNQGSAEEQKLIHSESSDKEQKRMHIESSVEGQKLMHNKSSTEWKC